MLIVALIGMLFLSVVVYYGIADVPFVRELEEKIGLEVKSGTAALNPKVALNSQLRAVLSNEAEVDLVSAFGAEISSLQGGEIQKKIMSCISFSTRIQSRSKELSVLVCDFQYPDLVGIAEEYFAKENTMDGFQEWVLEHLDENSPSLTMEVAFEMTRQDGRWKITVPAQFYDVLTGGIQSYLYQSYEDILTQLQEGNS